MMLGSDNTCSQRYRLSDIWTKKFKPIHSATAVYQMK